MQILLIRHPKHSFPGNRIGCYRLSIDLEVQLIRTPAGEEIPFDVDSFRKHCLLNGLDDIGITLQDADAIRAFEQDWQKASPWLFGAIK